MMLDRTSALPLYAQLEKEIRQKLDDKEWPVSSRIPSESELGRIYGISRMTARAVLNRLTAEGHLRRVPGKGTFVTEPNIISSPTAHAGLLDQLRQSGYIVDGETLAILETAASRKVAEALRLEHGARVVVARCRCTIRDAGTDEKETPISHHLSYLPASLFPDFMRRGALHNQVKDIIQREYQYHIRRYTETLQVKTASAEESSLLLVKTNTPLLVLDTVYYGDGDLPLGYSSVVFRGDKVKLKFEQYPV